MTEEFIGRWSRGNSWSLCSATMLPKEEPVYHGSVIFQNQSRHRIKAPSWQCCVEIGLYMFGEATHPFHHHQQQQQQQQEQQGGGF
jgi:hypothetical protein